MWVVSGRQPDLLYLELKSQSTNRNLMNNIYGQCNSFYDKNIKYHWFQLLPWFPLFHIMNLFIKDCCLKKNINQQFEDVTLGSGILQYSFLA